MSDIMLLSDIDCSKITFSEPKHNKGRATQVYLNYDGGRMPLIQTHLGGHAYKGISAFPNQETGKMQYSLELTFAGESTDQIEAAEAAAKRFDDFILKSAAKNSKPWMRKNLTEGALEHCHTKWLRVPTDKETGEPTDRFPKGIKLKLPTTEDETDFRFPIYHIKTEERIPPPPGGLIDYVPTGSSMRAILKCGGLWIVNGRFGVTFYVEQLQLAPAARLTTCAFRKTGEESCVASSSVVDLGASMAAEEEVESEEVDEDDSDGE